MTSKKIYRKGIQLNKALLTMLNELKSECASFQVLMDKLDQSQISGDEFDELVGEIIGSVGHLNVHSMSALEGFDDDLEN